MDSPITFSRRQANPIHLYINREPYRIAAGRQADRTSIQDSLADAMAMVALDQQQPSAASFLKLFCREVKVRGYQESTITSYTSAVRSILRWFGRPPHLLNREHVKNYLEYLFDGGHSRSDISVQLVAIRNAWDKFCFHDVTLGLATPRRRRKRIVVLSRSEVRRILQAAPSIRETLMIGLMYGTGVRVSELCRLRWQDIDHDRNQIFISMGKGNADRHVQLPHQYRQLLSQMAAANPDQPFVFPGETNHRADRHVSPRTVQRVVRNVCTIAGIDKPATPHSFRHAFATHSFEDGCDIRRIQTVLGHTRLETTTIYVKVAKHRTDFASPLDRLHQNAAPSQSDAKPRSTPTPTQPKPVGKLRLHARRDPAISEQEYQKTQQTQFTIEITGHGRREFLLGVIAQRPRAGFVTINLPPAEHWSATIAKLPTAMQDRIAQPDFYQTLQTAITTKMLASESHPKPPPKPTR